MIHELARTLRHAGRGPDIEPENVHGLQFVGGTHVDRHVRMFLFENGMREPYTVVKIAVTEASETALNHEADHLIRIAEVKTPGVSDTIPRVLLDARVNHYRSLFLSVLPGRSISQRTAWRSVKPNVMLRDAKRVSKWLATYHDVFPGSCYCPDGLEACLGWLADVAPSSVDALSQRLAALSADSVFGHGDFWCGNILLDQANIAVVDWECARSHMHPAFDLLTYIFTLSPRRPSMRAGVRGYYNVLVYNIMETILKSSAYTHAYRSAIDRYCSARKLDTKEICMYVPVFLAQMAHRVHLADPDAEARPGGNPWVEVLHQCMENPGPLFRT